MSPNTKAMLKGFALPALLVVAVGAGALYLRSTAQQDPILSLQCVDTASQETVYYKDYVLSAKSDYDVWNLETEESWVRYVQPTGVVCTLQHSVMAIENDKGKV